MRRDGVHDPDERRAAGTLTGLLWIIGAGFGALWYLVPGSDHEHLALGLVNCGLSLAIGIACVLAPWRRMSPRWFYAAAGLSLVIIPYVIWLNGGADSPTVLYLFLASVLFGYYLPTRMAIGYLAVGMLVPATPMLYDPQALEPAFIARYALTAPIYAGVGLAVVLAKRQLVLWRNQARDQALRDSLTGLANRRALSEALQEAIASRRADVGLVMVDLDNFKLANTLHGHVGGDRVLRSVAGMLTEVTRRGDLVARLGGDEFALLVGDTDEADLARLAQRIVEQLRSAEVALRPPGFEVTASVGFALLDPHRGVDDVLDAADGELRRAKRAGKDRWAAIGAA